MNGAPRQFTDEVVSDEVAAILRTKTPAERLKVVDGMWRSARKMIRAYLVQQHPDWTEEAIDQLTARRMSRGAF